MGTTPTFALPYPGATDPADVPLDMQELAERVEDAIGEPLAAADAALDTRLDAIEAAPSAMALLGEYDLAASGVVSAIPQGYDTLRIAARMRALTAGVPVAAVFALMNAGGAGNFDYSLLVVNNNAVSANQLLGQAQLLIGWAPGPTAVAGYKSALDLTIPGYSTAQQQKLIGTHHCFGPSGVNVSELYTVVVGGTYRQPQPVTSLSFFCSGGVGFAAGSRLWLYGMRGA